MKTRDLIVRLLDCDLDAEISLDAPESIADSEQIVIKGIEPYNKGFGSFTIIEVEAEGKK